MKASACFEYDGQSYRCVWSMPTYVDGDEVKYFPFNRRVYLRAEYSKLPRPGQYCHRPHEYLKG